MEPSFASILIYHHKQTNKQTNARSGQQHVVDVVVSPWVVREALQHRAFQAQVVALALEWVEEETGLRLCAEAPWAVLPPAACPYWDGDGTEKGERGGAKSSSSSSSKPRPFVLDEVRFL